jgi:DNA-binding LacI/PurR family transcriptional regulator
VVEESKKLSLSFSKVPGHSTQRSSTVAEEEPAARSTLAQIAQVAGVSVPTVSKVLNGREGVSSATREVVERALDAQGYVRRSRSRAESPRRSIDLVMAGLDGSWPASVASGVEAAAYESELHVVISVARSSEPSRRREERDWLDRVIERGSGGVVLGLVDLSMSQRLRLERAGLPVVMIHPLSDPPPGIASVGANTRAGAYDATDHLLRLGHRDIALVTGPHGQLSEQARISGYRSAMSAADVPVPPHFIRSGTYDRASGKRLVQQLIDLPKRPTAIFICSDHMAIGGYEALAEAGFRVPSDISVVGFDDLPEARWVYPALTTVRQPVKEMGRAAVHLLASLMAGEEVGSRRVEFATSLVLRQSTQALSAGSGARRAGRSDRAHKGVPLAKYDTDEVSPR